MNARMIGFSMAAMMMSATAAGAATITSQTFDVDPTLADSQAPGVWYVDRFAPAGFEAAEFRGDSRLAHSISASDGQTDNFRNTQGRKFDTPGATMLQIDFFIDAAFENAPGRIGGLWGTGFNADGVISAFPIIEFFDNQFQVFDSIPGDADGTGFRAVGTQRGFSFDEFVTLGISLDAGADLFSFFVNDELLHTEEAGGSVAIGNAILQNINTADGVDRTLYFDNFEASGPAAVIPLPAPALMLVSALVGFGLVGRRRRTS